MRHLPLSLLLLIGGPAGATPPCANVLVTVNQLIDYRSVVPRDQVIGVTRDPGKSVEPRTLRVKDPRVNDVSLSPDGRRALASFQTGEIVLFGSGEPTLLFRVPPAETDSKVFESRSTRRLGWTDEGEVAIVYPAVEAAADSRIERLVIANGRVDSSGTFEQTALDFVAGAGDLANLDKGLLSRRVRSGEFDLLPRAWSAPAKTFSARFPRLSVGMDFRKLARLFSRTRGVAPATLSAPSHPDREVLLRSISTLSAAARFAEGEILLTLSDAGQMALTLLPSGRESVSTGRLRLWHASDDAWKIVGDAGEYAGLIDRAVFSREPFRAWIFGAEGTLRIVDFAKAQP